MTTHREPGDPVEALLSGLPPVYEHTDSLLARAAADGPMRRRVVRAWAAIQRDPTRAAFALRNALRRARDLKPWERRLVAAGLYSMVRHHRLLAAVMGTPEADGEALWRGCLVRQGLPVDAAPEAAACADLEASARALLAPLDPIARLAVGGSVPDGVARRLAADLGPAAAAFLAASNQRAPLVVRIHATRAGGREAALARMAAAGLEPTPLSPAPGAVAIRRCDVFETDLYQEGWIEVQDAGSQAIAALCAPAPGEVVVDYCAGGGGKALALADAGAEVWTHDVRPAPRHRVFFPNTPAYSSGTGDCCADVCAAALH